MSTAVEPKKKRHPHRKDYTEAEVDMGLTAFAICSGRKKRAAELVREQSGLSIPEETIRSWAVKTHPERYERIRAEVAPKLQTQMADTHQALADTAAILEAKAVGRLEERLDQGDVDDRDLANIFKSAAIAGGIHIEKAQLLNNRPTQIVQKNASDILRSLKSRGLVVDAEVVGEETVG